MTELRFGALPIRPPLLLAPMAGLTHSPFRQLLADLGGVGLFTTEMLSARSLPSETPHHSPYLARTARERPLCYQLLLCSSDEIAPALAALDALDPQAVDVNMGCPAPLVRRRGGGSRLMQEPRRARALVAELRRRTTLPLSAKIRLGERLDEPALVEFCRMLEGEGVDLLTVHGRLRGEPYGRAARWSWIGKVKASVNVPVVGNGGIFSLEDARRCLEESGCDGLMLGRGAVVRPWLFADLAAGALGDAGVPALYPSRPELFRRYIRYLEAGLPSARPLGRLKEFTRLFSQTYAFGHSLATSVQNSATMAQAKAKAEEFFRANDPAWEGEG